MIYKHWHQAEDRWTPLMDDSPPAEIVEIAQALDELDVRACALGVEILVNGDAIDVANCEFRKFDPIVPGSWDTGD